MKKKYEYRVCEVQGGRITLVNGEWQGPGLADEAAGGPHEGCPRLWDYLNEAGSQGWDLVASSAPHTDQPGWERLYLRKELFG